MFEFRLGRSGLVCFLLGMAVLLFVFFLVGVKTGVDLDTYPERLASWPAALVRQLGLTSEPSAELRGKADALSVGMKSLEADHVEAEAKAAQEVLNEGAAKMEVLLGGTTVGELREAGPTEQPLQKVPGGLETSAKPVLEGKKEAKAPERPVAEKFNIRVAAFRELEKAENLRGQVAALGYNTVLQKVEHAKSGAWFRVEIRGIESREEAGKIISHLGKKFKGVQGVIKYNGGGGP